MYIISTVYRPRSAKPKHMSAVYQQQPDIMTIALLDDTAASTSAVYQPQPEKKIIFAAAEYHQRGIAV